jgi:hypothetical protein
LFIPEAKEKLPYLERSYIGRNLRTARTYFWDDCNAFSIHFNALVGSDGEKLVMLFLLSNIISVLAIQIQGGVQGCGEEVAGMDCECTREHDGGWLIFTRMMLLILISGLIRQRAGASALYLRIIPRDGLTSDPSCKVCCRHPFHLPLLTLITLLDTEDYNKVSAKYSRSFLYTSIWFYPPSQWALTRLERWYLESAAGPFGAAARRIETTA